MILGKMDLICVKPTVSTPSVVGSKRVTCRAALMRAPCHPCVGCERRCAGLRYRETLTPMPIGHGIAGHPRKIPRDERMADTRNAHFGISKVISGPPAPIVAISHVLDQLVMLQSAALQAKQFRALRLGGGAYAALPPCYTPAGQAKAYAKRSAPAKIAGYSGVLYLTPITCRRGRIGQGQSAKMIPLGDGKVPMVCCRNLRSISGKGRWAAIRCACKVIGSDIRQWLFIAGIRWRQCCIHCRGHRRGGVICSLPFVRPLCKGAPQ